MLMMSLVFVPRLVSTITILIKKERFFWNSNIKISDNCNGFINTICVIIEFCFVFN
ncbi:hypothetical protein GLYMA_14G195151v4 [Glycine max]|nr:hypothetical protein GLYMA_14G195151v4 [Glycine max]KAH1095333.1 hypothetical protein GYH30_040570 [Glycine max]